VAGGGGGVRATESERPHIVDPSRDHSHCPGTHLGRHQCTCSVSQVSCSRFDILHLPRRQKQAPDSHQQSRRLSLGFLWLQFPDPPRLAHRQQHAIPARFTCFSIAIGKEAFCRRRKRELRRPSCTGVSCWCAYHARACSPYEGSEMNRVCGEGEHLPRAPPAPGIHARTCSAATPSARTIKTTFRSRCHLRAAAVSKSPGDAVHSWTGRVQDWGGSLTRASACLRSARRPTPVVDEASLQPSSRN
jgi:hypothetical protein